jgi:hypothetical protein
MNGITVNVTEEIVDVTTVQEVVTANVIEEIVDVTVSDGVTIYEGQDKQYEHIQSPASATWTVAHNLGKVPSVTVIDSTGRQVFGGVQHTDTNNTILTFSAPFSGKAYFN